MDVLILDDIDHGSGQTLSKTIGVTVKCFPVSIAQFTLNQELYYTQPVTSPYHQWVFAMCSSKGLILSYDLQLQ